MNAIQIVRRDDRPLAAGSRCRRDSIPNRSAGGWANANSGLGTSMDRESYTDFVPGFPRGQATIDAILQFSAMGRRIVNREPDDAKREGFDISGAYTPAELAAIAKVLGKLEALKRVADARRWARGFGGGAVIVNAEDGRPASQPIDWPNLRRVRALNTVDRYEIIPLVWDRDPMSPRFGHAVVYQMSAYGGGGASRTGPIHSDRVIRFDGIDLPNRRKAATQGWGGSVIDLVWEELRNYGSSHRFAANAVGLTSQGVLQLSGLAEAIESGDFDIVTDRLEAIRLSMGILGDLALDKDESYTFQDRTFSGLAPLLERMVSALVAATDMPRTVLLGEQPSGLNASADSEIRAWYDHVATLQREIYTPAVLRILELVCRSAAGPTGGYWDPDTGIEWVALWQQSETEKAQTRLTRAQARVIDKNGGAVSVDEIRQDPDLAEHYPGLDAAAPAPEPPPPAPGFGQASMDSEPDGAPEEESYEIIVPAHPSEMIAGEALISAREVASMLGYATTSPVIKLAARGRVPAWKVQGRWKFQASSVRAAVAEQSNLKADEAPLPLG